MATKKDAAEKADEKETKKSSAKKTVSKKPVKPKAPEKKVVPEKLEAPAIVKPESQRGETPTIIDDSDKILKSSDVELPADEPAGKQKIVVSHEKSAKADDSIEVINAEEILKDPEYDFEYNPKTHEIKPYTGKTMTSHEMHQGKYGIIDDITKSKKKKR